MRAVVVLGLLGLLLVVPDAQARSAGCSGRAVAAVEPEVASHPRNRVEEAATPRHLACLSRTSFTLAPGRRLDPVRERLVLQVGDRLRVVRGLRQLGPRRWAFRGPATGAFAVRVGDDWGALDARGRRVVPEPVADTTRAAVGTIGPGGGSVRATDAAGVVATLQVPAGALKRATTIRVVPLAGPAVPGGGLSQAGLRFEPAGLVFAHPALLTLDYTGTAHRVSAQERISLVTSPLSALALPGSADPAAQTVTGVMAHFSTTVGGVTAAQLSDLTAWADPILRAGSRPTLSELVSLAALMAEQQRVGCTRGCVDAATLAVRTEAALGSLVRESCGLDIVDPSDGAMERWLALATLAQSVDVDSDEARLCAVRILESLVAQADDFDRLIALAARAQRLGEDAVQDLALTRAAADLRARLAEQRALCALDAGHARTRMEETRGLARLVASAAPTLGDDIAAAIAGCVTRPPVREASSEPEPDAPAAPVVPPVVACADTTDATRDALRALELAGQTGLHGCIAEILDAQIAAARGGASESATFARLDALGDWAQANAQPERATAARDALASALRALLTAAQTTCHSDPLAGLDDLNTVLAWAGETDDPTLAAATIDAIAGCDATPEIAVVVLGDDAAETHYTLCSATATDYTYAFLPGDQAPPVELHAHKDEPGGRSADMTLRITRPSPLEIGIGGTGRTTHDGAYSAFGTCLTLIQITPTVDGVLTLDAQPASSDLLLLSSNLYDLDEEAHASSVLGEDPDFHLEINARAGETAYAYTVFNVGISSVPQLFFADGRFATITFAPR